jgi:hypothetical protein
MKVIEKIDFLLLVELAWDIRLAAWESRSSKNNIGSRTIMKVIEKIDFLLPIELAWDIRLATRSNAI